MTFCQQPPTQNSSQTKLSEFPHITPQSPLSISVLYTYITALAFERNCCRARKFAIGRIPPLHTKLCRSCRSPEGTMGWLPEAGPCMVQKKGRTCHRWGPAKKYNGKSALRVDLERGSGLITIADSFQSRLQYCNQFRQHFFLGLRV
jgi:hypothetical protein